MTCTDCDKSPTIGASFYGSEERKYCPSCAVVMLLDVINGFTIVNDDGIAELVNDDVPRVHRIKEEHEKETRIPSNDAQRAMKCLISLIDVERQAHLDKAIKAVTLLLDKNQVEGERGEDGSFTEETWSAMRRAVSCFQVVSSQTRSAYEELQEVGSEV